MDPMILFALMMGVVLVAAVAWIILSAEEHAPRRHGRVSHFDRKHRA